MSERPQKKLRLLSSPVPVSAPRNRPPSPKNTVGVAMDTIPLGSMSASISSSGPHPSSSRILTVGQLGRNTNNSQVDERTIQRNKADLQRPTSMFSAIEQLQISGGNFNMNIHPNDQHLQKLLKNVALQSLPRSHDAAYSAAINLDNLSRRRCTNDTRVDIIAQIMTWVKENDPDKAPSVYWLTGLAGLGKTTIAYTICELLEEARLPFTSFFCSLQLDSRNSKLLVPTLCHDLAEIYCTYATNLLPILESNSKVVDAGLRIQIDELLAKPWQASIAQQDHNVPTPIVVVDALDESDRGTQFLEELLRAIHVGQLTRVKFLVTSRLDPKIVELCKSFPPNAVCKLHEVDTANVQNDIEKYLQEALPELKDEPELALLSERAGGLFIYATTAVRFISPPHSPPSVSEMRSHLRAMLNPGPWISHSDSDERLLVDDLYERILGNAFRDARVRTTRLRVLHTIVCAESRIDISVLADLTNTDQDTVKRVVDSLHAVLFVSSKDGCVYWYHASFPDFVFSRARAKISISLHGNRLCECDVFCDSPAHHGVLSRRCFSVMQESLHFNMCNLPSSYVFDSDVPWLNACIDETFSPTLRYVLRHWARHLLRSVDMDDLFGDLQDFLDHKLLFWMEAMNLIDAKSDCSSLLKDAECWLKREKESPDLLGQLADAINFSAFFAGSPASKSTPHLYISALAMWNQNFPTWRNWKHRFGSIPSIILSRGAITIPLLTISTGVAITSTAFSPDGNLIVSGSKTDSAWVWDAKTGELLRELQGHTCVEVISVAFSPDGNRIVSGSIDKIVRLWDAKTGEQLSDLQGHTDSVTSVAFSVCGDRIVSSSLDASVRVWDAKTGMQLMKLQGHAKDVNEAAFSLDGNRIVSGSCDKSVRVWDAQTGKELRKLQGHTHSVMSVAFSHNGNRIASGSYDDSARVWDAKTGQLLRELRGHTASVNSVAFSPDDKRIVSGSEDGSMRIWDVETGEQQTELLGHTSFVTSVRFSPDGNRVVSGGKDNSVRVWDAKKGGQVRELQGHTGFVTSVGFSPDGNQITSGSYDKSVRVWDTKTGEQLKKLQGHPGYISSVTFSPDGRRIISASYLGSVQIWDAKGQQLMKLQGGHIRSVALSPDGNQIVAGSSNTVEVWDAETGEQLRKLQGHTDLTTSVVFSLDRIVSGSNDKSVRVWDAKTGEQLRMLQGHICFVDSVGISPDSDRIVSCAGGSLRVWDTKTGQQQRELHTSYILSVAFSPDGNRIITGSLDKSIRLWDAQTGDLLRELQGHTARVASVKFSCDGNQIVSGSFDKSVRVWGNLNHDPSWVMTKDGWIVSGANRLVWVPSTIRNVLLRPHNLLVISRNGSAMISFEQCKLGPVWHECYTP